MAYKLILMFFLLAIAANAQLTPDFYSKSCPQALSTIKSMVDAAIANETRMGASLLRLHFHDCFVNGCDGSVLLDDTPNMRGEKFSYPNNKSLRGYDVVEEIKAQLETICPQTVSCADLLAVAARDSVVRLGGPSWTVLLGRRDSKWASFDDANANMPSTHANYSELVSDFQSKGLSVKDLIVLSGAHTVGQSRCASVYLRLRFSPQPIEANLLASLKEKCPGTWGGPSEQDLFPMDETPDSFDTAYFENLMSYKGVLFTDQMLYGSGNSTTDFVIKDYAEEVADFFGDFGISMVKMGNISVLTETEGEIRKICSRVNTQV